MRSADIPSHKTNLKILEVNTWQHIHDMYIYTHIWIYIFIYICRCKCSHTVYLYIYIYYLIYAFKYACVLCMSNQVLCNISGMFVSAANPESFNKQPLNPHPVPVSQSTWICGFEKSQNISAGKEAPFYWNQRVQSVGSVGWSDCGIFESLLNWSEELHGVVSCCLLPVTGFSLSNWMWCVDASVHWPKLIQRASNLRHYEMTAVHVWLTFMVACKAHKSSCHQQQTQSNTCNISMSSCVIHKHIV